MTKPNHSNSTSPPARVSAAATTSEPSAAQTRVYTARSATAGHHPKRVNNFAAFMSPESASRVSASFTTDHASPRSAGSSERAYFSAPAKIDQPAVTGRSLSSACSSSTADVAPSQISFSRCSAAVSGSFSQLAIPDGYPAHPATATGAT